MPRTPRAIAAALSAAGLALAAGCGGGGSSTPVNCGTSRTAANVPLTIKIGKGSVACAVALQVERSYTAMVASGQIKGNGGGAPVQVGTWTCQAFPTSKVLQTGEASECRNGSTEIFAVLPAPSASP